MQTIIYNDGIYSLSGEKVYKVNIVHFNLGKCGDTSFNESKIAKNNIVVIKMGFVHFKY